MANHLMFWRSAGLEQTIHHNQSRRRTQQDRRHLSCAEHSPAEVAAFERSLSKPAFSAWQKIGVTKH